MTTPPRPSPNPTDRPAPPKRKRAAGILLRATDDERAELLAAADAAGQSLQAWALGKLLAAARRAR